MQEQRSYYLIGYRPDESTFDRKTGMRTFHKLTLKVTRAGNFNVRMRNGFYGISDQELNAKPRTPYPCLASLSDQSCRADNGLRNTLNGSTVIISAHEFG
jgi:hypothetical protein